LNCSDKRLIIGLSGRKQSGKSSLALYIKHFVYCYFKNLFYSHDKNHYSCVQLDDTTVEIYKNHVNRLSSDKYQGHSQIVSVEDFAFADAIKETCMNIFGLSYEQCYGTDVQKNSFTQFKWDFLPEKIRKQYAVNSDLRSGYMTARELMQIFGTEIVREMFGDDIWVKSTFRKIEQDFMGRKNNYVLYLISDVRHVCEVNKILKSGGYIIRLERKLFDDKHVSETSLDDFDFSAYPEQILQVDNSGLSIGEKNILIKPFLLDVFNSYYNL